MTTLTHAPRPIEQRITITELATGAPVDCLLSWTADDPWFVTVEIEDVGPLLYGRDELERMTVQVVLAVDWRRETPGPNLVGYPDEEPGYLVWKLTRDGLVSGEYRLDDSGLGLFLERTYTVVDGGHERFDGWDVEHQLLTLTTPGESHTP
ncbi:hypothetical protein ACIBH1_45730 [Nonomuraea sp. NPDC050663]|uniref:hypothetical protein n=1 Tax=Nonomuraea sp. NPDC050663 TaxID=3364370 RepID=UPI003798074F